MALARIKTWNPGDVLTAADLNAEFNNPLNNPISLISPTTGAINFQTSVAHTNLQVSALTASSGFAGSVLVGSTAATPSPVWSTGAVSGGLFMATTASIPTWLTIGTSGQVLIAASSGTAVYSTGMNFVTTNRMLHAQRFGIVSQAATLTSANFSLTSGWGTSGTISVAGGDQAYRFTVTVGATTVANPSITTTFIDIWSTIPSATVIRPTGGSGYSGGVVEIPIAITQNSSGQVFQMLFTPTTGATYTFNVINFG